MNAPIQQQLTLSLNPADMMFVVQAIQRATITVADAHQIVRLVEEINRQLKAQEPVKDGDNLQ